MLALLFYIFHSRCNTQNGLCWNTCVTRFFYILVWNSFLRSGIQMSLQLGLASILNIFHVCIHTYSDRISVSLSVFILCLFILLPFLIIRIISVQPSILSSKQYKRKYGTIYWYSGRLSDYSRGIYYPLLLMHQYFFIFVCFFIRNPVHQVMLMLLSSLFLFLYLYRCRPFATKFDLVFFIINIWELILVFGLCFLFCFSEHPSHL